MFSTTLDSVEHGATLHRSVDAVPVLKELDRRGWVDSYVFHVNPVVLGAGTPLCARGERQDLRLVAHKDYDDGVVQLSYDIVR